MDILLLVVHCLVCKEPQDDIHEHLASGCLTDGTPDERAAAADQAQASTRDWARNARVWDFQHLCRLLPDRGYQVAMVKELLRLGFLIRNQPDLSEAPQLLLHLPALPPPPLLSSNLVSAKSKCSKASFAVRLYRVKIKLGNSNIIIGMHLSCLTRSTGCLHQCKTILRVAKEDTDRIRGDLELGCSISRRDKTVYHYCCEAVLVYNHVQVPMAVQNLTNGIYANISLFHSYSEVTVATRPSLYPDQMVTAVPRIQSVPSLDHGSPPGDDFNRLYARSTSAFHIRPQSYFRLLESSAKLSEMAERLEFTRCLLELPKVTINDVTLRDSVPVVLVRSSCTCAAGQAVCNHLVALLYQTAHYSESGMSVVPTVLSCTETEQKWHKQRSMGVKPGPVDTMVVVKARPGTSSTSGIRSTLQGGPFIWIHLDKMGMVGDIDVLFVAH
ncbi:uncharacterized protein [Garra rufa]|uniref:uncharacterized protein n=1 Tax=Garra rufa TaxID=137080 RepID=UPI003CCEB34B